MSTLWVAALLILYVNEYGLYRRGTSTRELEKDGFLEFIEWISDGHRSPLYEEVVDECRARATDELAENATHIAFALDKISAVDASEELRQRCLFMASASDYSPAFMACCIGAINHRHQEHENYRWLIFNNIINAADAKNVPAILCFAKLYESIGDYEKAEFYYEEVARQPARKKYFSITLFNVTTRLDIVWRESVVEAYKSLAHLCQKSGNMVKTEVYLRHLALELKDAASAYTYAKYILSPDDPAWLRFMILAFEGKETDAGLELGFQYLSKSLRKPNIESTSADKKSMTDSKGHKLETVSAKAAIDSFLVGLSPQAIFGTEDASTDELPSSGSKLLTKAEITATARAPRACLALALLLRSQNHMNQSYMWLNKLYKIRSQKMLAAWYANVWSERLRYPFIYGDGEVPKTWCLEGLAEDWIKEERLIRAQRRQEEEKARKYKK